METQTDANAGADAGLTSTEGTPDGTQSLNDKKVEDKTLEGLSRRVTKQQQEIVAKDTKIAELEAKADTTGKESNKESEELANLKSEKAKLELQVKYPDVAAKLGPMLKRGLNPELVDDEFVAVIREGTEAETVPHNPLRGKATEAQEAERLLRSLETLF